MMRFKRTGEIEYDLTKTKKKAFAVALKKKLRLFTIFPNSISVFQTFSRFSRIQDSVRTLGLKTAIIFV